MEKKIDTKLNFLIFLFIVALVGMAIMGFYIHTLHNQLLSKEAEIRALSNSLNSLEIIQNYHDLVEDIEILNKSAEQEEVSEVTTEGTVEGETETPAETTEGDTTTTNEVVENPIETPVESAE